MQGRLKATKNSVWRVKMCWQWSITELESLLTTFLTTMPLKRPLLWEAVNFASINSHHSQSFVKRVGWTYFIITEGLAGVLNMRKRHPQGFQFSAAGQQFSLELVLLSLDPLCLRLQAGQLHCAHNHKQGTINKKALWLLKNNSSFLYFKQQLCCLRWHSAHQRWYEG